MYKGIITFFLFAMSQSGFAQQEKTFIIAGKVLDSLGAPIEKASVVETQTSKGTATNRQGYFFLKVSGENVKLQISHISYEAYTKEINDLNSKMEEKDTLFLTIQLRSKLIKIKPVEIRSNGIQLIEQQANLVLMDYEFHPKGILLLLKENNQSKLRLIDDNYQILFELLLEKKPQNLYKDCLEQLHLQYKDSSFLLAFEQQNIWLNTGYGLEEFNKSALPCIQSIDDQLFLGRYNSDKNSLLYAHFDKKSKKSKIIHLINDQERMNINEDFRNELTKIRAKTKGGFAMGDNGFVVQKHIRELDRETYYLEKILMFRIVHPMVKIRDSIFIFNHLLDTAYVYNAFGDCKRKFHINHHKIKDWAREIIVDYEQEKIYAKYKNKGFVYLRQIEPEDGTVLRSKKIEAHTFPENLKIRDGHVYYFYTDNNQRVTPKRMYRQKLN